MIIDLLVEYGMFLAKVATFLVAILIIIGAIVSASQKPRSGDSGNLVVKKINDNLAAMQDALRDSVMDEHARKALHNNQKKEKKRKNKDQKKQAKASKKTSEESANASDKKVYVLSFDGDMKASQVDNLGKEISAVLTLAEKQDEVVLKLESPGGMVHAYGLAASQLERIKAAEIPLTICVDKVAASGGYMMACIADKILAAPFAILGSIGVVASLPNFNRILKKNDVDYELLTAGEYKRTLTMLGENTDKGREKFMQDLEDTHTLFKQFVSEYRPQLSIAEVATGETWYGKKAIEKNLIDGISTSDGYIIELAKDFDVFDVKFKEKQSWQEKLGVAAEAAIERSFNRIFHSDMVDRKNRY